jgi:hypothetical protein
VKSHKLARFVAPPPPPKPVCAACKAWSPEVTVPAGEGAIDLCWLCAHHHVDHGVSLRQAPEAQCECTAAEIYPRDARQGSMRAAARVAVGLRPVITATSDCDPRALVGHVALDPVDRTQPIPRWRSRGK